MGASTFFSISDISDLISQIGMISRLPNSMIASFLLSGSLLFQAQPASAESVSTDILFTGTVPVTCAFSDLSPTDQLDPHSVTSHRQTSCNEGTINIGYDSIVTESATSSTSSENEPLATKRSQQQRIITLTVQ